MLSDLRSFLSSKSNLRARNLINIPSLVHSESGSKSSGRCLLVLEDVSVTRRCSPADFSSLEGGLDLRETRVLLGTLAQVHAAALAWKVARRSARARGDLRTTAAEEAEEAMAKSDGGLCDVADEWFKAHGEGEHQDDGGEDKGDCDCGECTVCVARRMLGRYERLLKWQQKDRRANRRRSAGASLDSPLLRTREGGRRREELGKREEEDFERRIKLVRLLASEAPSLLSVDFNSEREDLTSCLCLGPVSPADVLFQKDEMAEILRELSLAASSTTASAKCSNGSSSSPSSVRPPPPPPLCCAALLSCGRAHLGLPARDLASALLSSASPLCRRRHNLVPLLQCYCHVLAAALEAMDVDWGRQFQLSFAGFLHKFYEQVGRPPPQKKLNYGRKSGGKRRGNCGYYAHEVVPGQTTFPFD